MLRHMYYLAYSRHTIVATTNHWRSWHMEIPSYTASQWSSA